MAGNAPHIPGCRELSLIGERLARSLFSAYSDRVGRPVTVTVFPPLSEGRTAEGFDRAAAVAQRLGAHPSVLTIHEWGHADDGRPWIVTEPQPPESVDTLLTMDGPLEVERSLQVGVLLAGALETAHRAGIVHGDLQPARLVFGAHGEPLLVETGLAAFAVFPGLGALNNPVRYFAPPEVLERTETTTATDVYSLATTVYALLAGRAPQQKPAEITDSNASLLLRILQMPVPSIDRPDLPPGLEDALRGPLSPTPARRPQRAIEVAWLLQDVQRRAGFAVTEPVVLDLDAVGGDTRVPSEVRAGSTGGGLLAPAVGPGRFDTARSSAPPAEAGLAPAAEAGPAPAADPWASAAPSARLDPVPDFAPEVVPPPTIFPFAEGIDDRGEPAARAGLAADSPPGAAPEALPWSPVPPSAAPEALPWSSPPAADAAEQSPWSPPPPADAAEQSLWPSSWPAEPPPDELPSWAAPPPDDGGAPAGGGPFGGDGGSLGDLAPANGNGNGAGVHHEALAAEPPAPSAAPLPSDPPGGLPPELDELPAWYTDPLPNAAPGGSNGAAWPPAAGGGRDDAPPWTADPAPDPDSLWPAPPAHEESWPPSARSGDGGSWPAADDDRRANGHGDRQAVPPGRAGGQVGLPSAAADERLPGAGDELRSLFGEVVRDPAEDGPGRPALGPGAPARDRAGSPDADPLGPPSDRPPIDLSRLDTPLGPAPFLPASKDADGAGGERPGRLPRRHEVQAWAGAEGRDGPDGGGAPPRLPRADEAYPLRSRDGEPGGPGGRPERPMPRQVAPDPSREARTGSAAAAGPPALPLIILIAVVAILVLGVAWLVITGDEAEAPASDRPVAEDADADSDADDTGDTGGAGAVAGAAGAPTGVVATPVPEGVQVTWTGAADTSYVVTVLSPDQPPQALPPALGTSVLVPNAAPAAAGGRCFTVATAPDAQGVAGTPSAPVCTPGATPEGMQQAAPPA